MSLGAQSFLMFPLLGVASILQATVTSRVAIGGVKPDLVLLMIISWTLVFGGRSGVVWAFVGGIWLDIFSGGPLGTSSLSLMAAAIVVGVGYSTLSRTNILVPLIAAMIGTTTFSLSYLGILAALAAFDLEQSALPFWPTIENVVVPSTLYNVTLMLLVVPFMNRIPQASVLH